MAGAEHDDRSERRLPRVSFRHQRASRSGLCAAAAAPGRRRALGRRINRGRSALDGQSGNGEGLIMENKVRLEFTHQSQIARITMNAPKANILDRAMMLGLAAAFEELTAQSNVKAIV